MSDAQKYMCMNNECYASFMALSNPLFCQRCGSGGVLKADDAAQAFPGIPSDVPSIIHEMREDGAIDFYVVPEETMADYVDEGMDKLLDYLRRGDEHERT